MTQSELILIACGVLGVLIHSVIKCNDLLQDARVANITFHWQKDYLQRDALAIALALLSVAVWYFIFGEVAATYPKIEAFARTGFVVSGMFGSYILQKIFSRGKKLIRQQIDAKTNLLNIEQGKPAEAKTTL